MHLEKELGDKLVDTSGQSGSWVGNLLTDWQTHHEKHENHGAEVKVEWQLTSPFDPTADMEGDQEGGQEYACN